jgi:YgiT-type zinc finger domain-containing protein
MKCTLRDCPGTYEAKEIIHSVRHHGEVVVIDHVPALVCDCCGDVLLEPETVRRIESILDSARPVRSAPLYEFA